MQRDIITENVHSIVGNTSGTLLLAILSIIRTHALVSSCEQFIKGRLH